MRVTNSLSDNQAYPQACLTASLDYAHFNGFRRDEIYTSILEHVTEEQGQAYLDLLSRDPELLASMDRLRDNDLYGGPRVFEYGACGSVSPSTLRYAKVLLDLKSHFGTLDDLKICEIGVGYGGQCRIIHALYSPARYTLVDIKPALMLAQRFLDHFVLGSVLRYRTMNELDVDHYDLVISNYAFTELSRKIQDIYLEKVILKSRRGYITYNEITPEEFHSYKADELLRMIPGSRRFDEEPLTHPNNCIIAWGMVEG